MKRHHREAIHMLYLRIERCHERYLKAVKTHSKYKILPAQYLVYLGGNDFSHPCCRPVDSPIAQEILADPSMLDVVGIYCMGKGKFTEKQLVEDYKATIKLVESYDTPLSNCA